MNFTPEQIEQVKLISDKLGNFKEELLKIDYVHNKPEFFKIMKEFRKYLVDISKECDFEVFKHSKNFEDYRNFFTEINEYYVRSIEAMQALSVMTQWIHNFNHFSELIDKDFVRESFIRKEKELAPLNLSKDKKFVMAWSGPFPETLLYIYENTEIENILWLDYNHEAIYMSGELLNWLGLDNISFKHVDAIEYDYKDADIVSIPIFVPLKTEIINQAIKTWKDDIQILVASPKWFLNLIYKPLCNITPRANITYREDLSTDFIYQEIIKIEKFKF